MRRQLGLPGGQLIANPIPPRDEIQASLLKPLITQAQSEAAEQGLSGKSVTPFLLQRLFELTNGQTLTANIALIRNNARLAAGIAIELKAQCPA